jgi:hypothetical protein
MTAGPMNKWLQIFAASESVGTSRDVQRSWSETPDFQVWARKRTLSAGEATFAAARQSSEDVVFEMWPFTGLTNQHRILCEGVYYDITGIRDPNGANRSMTVYASSGQQYGAMA